MGEFKGFGKQALPFFKALRFHQNKAWFDENRALYESDVMEPMTALLDGLTETFAKKKIPLRADGKRSIFRIHRDVRFAKDKTPYKTHAGAVMTRTGKKDANGLLYIHIDPDGCFAAAGFHMPEPADLLRIRSAIRAKPAAFTAMTAKLKKAGLALDPASATSRLPKGFEELKGSALDEAIRLKSFIVEEKMPDKLLHAPGLEGWLAEFASRSMPLLAFGWEAVGEATRMMGARSSKAG